MDENTEAANNAAPDPTDFSSISHERTYEVTFRVTGTMTASLSASSPEEARQRAAEMARELQADLLDIKVDEINDVSVRRVSKMATHCRVTRDGADMQVTRLEPGDVPRDPDEMGF